MLLTHVFVHISQKSLINGYTTFLRGTRPKVHIFNGFGEEKLKLDPIKRLN